MFVFIGRENVWYTTGMRTFSLDKIKKHKDESLTHKQAEEVEPDLSSGAQPGWLITQQRQLNKYEISIQNLMMICVHLCKQDLSLNSFESLCILLEELGVELLPAQVSGVSYRNGKAALCFIEHISTFLHEELLEKIKKSPVYGMLMFRYILNWDIVFFLGWMMDESTSRTTEKSCIIYVRYVENCEAKTACFGLLDLEGDETAENIVKSLSNVWKKDNLTPIHSCWLSSDNASTFTGGCHCVLIYL